MPDPDGQTETTPSPSNELGARIEARLSELTGGRVSVLRIEPLGGGACQDNYKVELAIDRGVLAGQRKMALRSDSPRSLMGSLDRRAEFAVIGAAVSRGVKTPPAHWLTHGLVRPGAWAYFLDWIEGTAIGRQVIKLHAAPEHAAALATALANELTKIHSITAITHPQLFEGRDRQERTDPIGAGLVLLRRSIDVLASPRPALELAYDWLLRHRPEAREVTLVHGDFRNGNFMIAPTGLVGVLDWEFSHFGSPFEDLAWIAVRDWRFGELKKPIGGFAPRRIFYDAYRKASGRDLQPERLHWWEIFGNARWAAGALAQGERYYAGEKDLELIAIARRAAEMEYEAIRLIERGPDVRPS